MIDSGLVRARSSAVTLALLLPVTGYAAWHRPAVLAPTAATAAGRSVTASPASSIAEPLELPVIETPVPKASPVGSRRWRSSEVRHLDLPAAAQQAYRFAAGTMTETDPGCGLRWSLLAAIGRIESDHGRHGESDLGVDGVSRPGIRGLPLNGKGPVAEIRDTDGGRLDGDEVWDRAVGPMQFLPSTWGVVGVDADGDGQRNPDDIHDAALGAAVYLCSQPGSIASGKGEHDAIYRYNHSESYVASVRRLERAYRTGDFSVIGNPFITLTLSARAVPGGLTAMAATGQGMVPAMVAMSLQGGSATAKPKPAAALPDATSSGTGSGSGTGGTGSTGGSTSGQQPTSSKTPDPTPAQQPDPTPTQEPDPTPTPTQEPDPTPTPTQEPDPTPTPEPTVEQPAVVDMSGTLSSCGGGWCLDGQALSLGATDGTAADYDGDGVTEAVAEELAGLAGQQVTLTVQQGTPLVVLAINGMSY